MAGVVTERIYKGDVGVRFSVATGIDLTNATKIEIHVKDINGLEDIWTAAIGEDQEGDDPLNQRAQYDTISGDLDVAGKFTGFAYVEFGSSSKHTGSKFTFSVYEPYT